MSEKAKGIGLFGLIGMVVSSCIGSGVFAITGQLAGVASPGAVLVAWAFVGIGFAALALSLNNLGAKKPELKGIFQYAEEGFGPFAGFRLGLLAVRMAGQHRIRHDDDVHAGLLLPHLPPRQHPAVRDRRLAVHVGADLPGHPRR